MERYEGYETLDIHADDQGVVQMMFNRPERLNAFNGAMRYEIRRFINEFEADGDGRVMVMTGAGRAFCSGADLADKDQRPWPTRATNRCSRGASNCWRCRSRRLLR